MAGNPPGPPRTPVAFRKKWNKSTLNERSSAQEHFLDLCAVLNIETPATADPKGQWFRFEKQSRKVSGDNGWADVWREDCFVWEYKKKKTNLKQALDQLASYSPLLNSPPLHIVCDIDQLEIHTRFNGHIPQIHTIDLTHFEMDDVSLIRQAFEEPESFRPDARLSHVTLEAARVMGKLGMALRGRCKSYWSITQNENSL